MSGQHDEIELDPTIHIPVTTRQIGLNFRHGEHMFEAWVDRRPGDLSTYVAMANFEGSGLQEVGRFPNLKAALAAIYERVATLEQGKGA